MEKNMEPKANFCTSGGYLVGAKGWLPTSPSAYNFGAPGIQVGCNQLKCGNCGVKVRAEQGWKRTTQESFQPAELYEAPDWNAVEGLAEGPMTLYSCLCDYVFVDMTMSMDLNSELAVETGPDFPSWGCAGHPVFELPGEAGDRLLETAEDVAFYAAEILEGAWHKSHPNPVQYGWPGFLLWRLYAQVRDVGLGELVSKQALDALLSEDPVQRAVAIAFFKAFPTAPGGEQLAATYLANRSLFDGVPDPIMGWQDLGLLFELTLQARVDLTHDSAALEVIRAALLADAPLNGLRFQLLQEIDRVWLEEHRDDLLKAVPNLIGHWVYMVRAWPEEVLLQELNAIERWTMIGPAELRGAVQTQLQEYPEKQKRIIEQI